MLPARLVARWCSICVFPVSGERRRLAFPGGGGVGSPRGTIAGLAAGRINRRMSADVPMVSGQLCYRTACQVVSREVRR